MKSTLFLIAGFALAVIFTSCEKTGPTGPAGPLLTGTLDGFISHYTPSGSKMTTFLGGDTISIDSTSLWTVSNGAGYYSFTGIKTGIYSLTVRHLGYGLLHIYNTQFIGGGSVYHNASLSQIPVDNISIFSVMDTTMTAYGTSGNYIRGKFTVPVEPYSQSVIVFVGIPGDTTVNSLPANEISSYVITFSPYQTDQTKNIPMPDFYAIGYNTTNPVYFAAYIIGASTGSSSYADLVTGKTIYTALSAPLFANTIVH
jgi:hypothetical protein